MKVLQDYQTFVRQRFGGVSRYHFELYRHLNRKGIKTDIFVAFPRCEYLYPYRAIYRFEAKWIRDLLLLLNDFLTFIHIVFSSFFGKKYDIVHITWYMPFYLKWIKRLPLKVRPVFIITVYDLIQERIKSEFTYMERGAKQKRVMFREADGFLCISEQTKRDLLKYYPNALKKPIEVTHLACSEDKKKRSRRKINEKYILYVGNRESYKNFNNFVKAAAPILHENRDYVICCIGGGKFSQIETELIKLLGVDQKIVQREVSEEEIYDYYRFAECFVYPSLHEGFGIPVLEAFYCECPVILHCSRCFTEVAGNAAAYFDGRNISSIAAAIRKVLFDMGKREKMIRNGKMRVKDFSWEETTKKTIDLYERCIKEKGVFDGKV